MGLKLNDEGKETPYIKMPNFFFLETYDLLQSKMLELDKIQSWGLQGGVWENIRKNKTSGINMDTCRHLEPVLMSSSWVMWKNFIVLAYLGSLD